MRKVYSIVILAVLGIAFQACGQKGPLRLPERAKPATVPVEPTAQITPPASDKPKEP